MSWCDLVGIYSWLTLTWSHLHQGWNEIGYTNGIPQDASTRGSQVIMDGVASSSLIGIPTKGDTFRIYYIFCMGMGFSAPQANGRSIFAIQGKALWEQGAMPPAVLGAIHLASSNIAKSGTSPNMNRDKMFNEPWWLHYCFCEEIDIGNVGTPCFGGEAVNIWCHSWRGMTMVGDPSCSGICDRLCIDKMFSELWWLNYCFCVGIGNGAVGNPTLGGETLSICCHNRCVIIDEDDTICRSIRAGLSIMDHCSCHQPQDFPSAFAFT